MGKIASPNIWDALFEPVDFVAALRAFAMYDAGRTADGRPIEPPPYYVEAKQIA